MEWDRLTELGGTRFWTHYWHEFGRLPVSRSTGGPNRFKSPTLRLYNLLVSRSEPPGLFSEKPSFMIRNSPVTFKEKTGSARSWRTSRVVKCDM